MPNTVKSHISDKKLASILKAVLEEPYKSIERLSRRFKFGTQSHFSNSFKKAVGISPLQYRNNPVARAQADAALAEKIEVVKPEGRLTKQALAIAKIEENLETIKEAIIEKPFQSIDALAEKYLDMEVFDAGDFSTAFKKLVGIPPLQYRKQEMEKIGEPFRRADGPIIMKAIEILEQGQPLTLDILAAECGTNARSLVTNFKQVKGIKIRDFAEEKGYPLLNLNKPEDREIARALVAEHS